MKWFPYIRVGDVGDDPLHGLGPEGFPSQGVLSNHGKADTYASEWRLGVPPPPPGGGDTGDGLGGGGGISLEEAEYNRAVYCDTTNYGPLRGSGAEAGDEGI